MQTRKKVLLVSVAVLSGLVMLACAFNFGTDTESMPGLAGTWQDPETYDTFEIVYQNGIYEVTSVVWENTEYDITSQSWSNDTLTWTYYIPESDISLSYETSSLSGDSLYTNWWNDAGASGTETLTRIR